MFESKEKRYVTKGVNQRVPLQLQLFCWYLIDDAVKKKEHEIDYLQIFEIKPTTIKKVISVIHRQEQPEFKQEGKVAIKDDSLDFETLKLWVIDDETHQTMLLPEEY